MKREILFRGQTRRFGEKVNMMGEKLPGRWVYGGVLQGTGDFSIIYGNETMSTSSADLEKRVVYTDTLGQYTGLTDKNGKRIFEGDIIRYADKLDYEMYKESLEAPEVYEGVDFSDLWTVDKIVYGLEYGYPAFDLCNHEFDCNGLSELSESMDYYYEVIGNIHDNPELLEE